LSLRIVEDGSIGRVDQAPRVVLPCGVQLFVDRAARFAQLAAGHPMGDYLRLMTRIAHAQANAFDERRAPRIDPAALEQSRQYGMPPLSAQSHARASQWLNDLLQIIAAVRAGAGEPLTGSLATLAAFEETMLEALADRVLTGSTLDTDAAFVPFVGAALQVYFARLAASLNAADVEQCDVATVCPVCATRPVASVIRIGGRRSLRYAHCALCGTEWNVVRVKCTACEDDKGVHYLSLESERLPTDAVVRAEACDECKSYLKIFNQENDPLVEPYADDLATLALDVLVDEQGFARSGPNLLFHPGSG
jgi:FdhE protein